MASNYNSRRRPAEVLVDGGEAKLIRRRERWARGAGEAADGTPLPPIAIAAADSSDWRVQAGLAANDLMVYRPRGAQSVDPTVFRAVVLGRESNRTLMQAYLGRVDLSPGQSLAVYVDDHGDGSSSRTWYDGVAVAPVASRSFGKCCGNPSLTVLPGPGGRPDGRGRKGRISGSSAVIPGSFGTPGYIGGIDQGDDSPCAASSGGRSAEGACARRSWASIRLDGERPRSTSRPSRVSTSADASAETMRRNLFSPTRPRSIRPFSTDPSFTTWEKTGVAAHAT